MEKRNLLGRLLTKKTFYVLCFLGLSLVEFLRCTQPGNIWKAAANCTGIVMMFIVFSGLDLKSFLRPFGYVYTALCLVAAVGIYWYWTGHVGYILLGQAETALFNIWWLGLVWRHSFDRLFVKKDLKLSIGINGGLWIALSVWTVISVAGRWWPIWFLFMFGAFYLVHYSKQDLQDLFDAMVDGTILACFLIQGWAYLFRPYDEVRYKGAFANCNMMGLYYLIAYCMTLYKLHILHIKGAARGRKLFWFAVAGGLLGFQFLTMSRTAWLVAIVVTVVYGLTALRRVWGDSIGKLLMRGVALMLAAAVLFPAVYLSVRWIPTIHPHPVWFEGEYSESRVHSWDPADSPKYVSIDEVFETAFQRLYKSLRMMETHNPFVLHAYAKSGEGMLDEISIDLSDDAMKGRLSIYKTYLKNATWLGRPETDGHYFMQNGFQVWHAQNLWIQIVYYFGYPAGILLLALTVTVLVSAFRRQKDLAKNPRVLLLLLIVLVYFLFGLMEIVWNPGQLILALIFLVHHPQFIEIEGNNE